MNNLAKKLANRKAKEEAAQKLRDEEKFEKEKQMDLAKEQEACRAHMARFEREYDERRSKKREKEESLDPTYSDKPPSKQPKKPPTYPASESDDPDKTFTAHTDSANHRRRPWA